MLENPASIATMLILKCSKLRIDQDLPCADEPLLQHELREAGTLGFEQPLDVAHRQAMARRKRGYRQIGAGSAFDDVGLDGVQPRRARPALPGDFSGVARCAEGQRMSTIYRGTADSQFAPELPAPPKGGLVSTLFGGYLGRDPDNQPSGVNPADLDGGSSYTTKPGAELVSQLLGPPDGGFVFDHFDSFLGRTPDAGAPTMHDFNLTVQDSQTSAGLDGQFAMSGFDFHFAREEIPNPFEPRAFANADASHMDALPAVQAFLPAVQVNALPAVQTDILPAVQVFASDWLWM